MIIFDKVKWGLDKIQIRYKNLFFNLINKNK